MSSDRLAAFGIDGTISEATEVPLKGYAPANLDAGDWPAAKWSAFGHVQPLVRVAIEAEPWRTVWGTPRRSGVAAHLHGGRGRAEASRRTDRTGNRRALRDHAYCARSGRYLQFIFCLLHRSDPDLLGTGLGFADAVVSPSAKLPFAATWARPWWATPARSRKSADHVPCMAASAAPRSSGRTLAGRAPLPATRPGRRSCPAPPQGLMAIFSTPSRWWANRS